MPTKNKESDFQKKLKNELKRRLPGCIVIKNDPTCIQGIPDLTVFYENKWATLEVKRSRTEVHRPNQDYYVDRMNSMSFSSFVYPENFKEVLDALERSFKA